MKQGNLQQDKFGDDRPIENNQQDRLGFTKPAELVAQSIQNFASAEGFVFGIEGEWGAGKTGFINLIDNSLKEMENAPKTIRFSPWLINSREGLLKELFHTLSDSVDKDNPLREKFKSYSNHLSTLGSVAGLAGLFLPGAAIVEKGANAASEALGSLSKHTPLETQKKDIKIELRNLNHKIVIFIDDLDRLEPKEAGEVVRLIRAIADFPNIVYVLCYSRRILAQSLENALQIKDGDAYIEKIVQVSFAIPKPQAFDLRRMFREELTSLFPNIFETDNEVVEVVKADKLQRTNSVIDIEGGQALNTPRLRTY